MKFPKQLYVRIDGQPDDEYFAATQTIDGEHGDKVAIYILKEIKTLVIKEELVK